MKTTKRVTDEVSGHTWDFTALDQYTLHLVESMIVEQRNSFTDLSNELWVFAILEVSGSGVSFRTECGNVPVPAGVYGFFKPPYSLTELCAESAGITFDAILSRRPLPLEEHRAPMLFDIERQVLPESYDALFELLSVVPVRAVVSRYGADVSGIALKIRQLIEDTYHESITLQEIARRSGISRNLLSMYFKRDFHITPSEYRKQLRIKASVLQLLECAVTNDGVAEIAFNCGYNDLSRYNKQFKAFTGVTPRQLKT